MSASRWRDERGLTLPVIAAIIGTLILMVSFAVDLGRQRSDRRLAQAGADVVALDMMRVVQGRTLKEVVEDPTTLTALAASASRNGFTNTFGFVANADPHLPRITDMKWGTVAALDDGDTFDELVYNTADDSVVPNAVQIEAKRTTDYFFQPGERGVTRLAIAALPQPVVDLHLGSVAAGFQPNYPAPPSLPALNQTRLDRMAQSLNKRLAKAFGSADPNAGLDAASYQGLAAADVELGKVASHAGFGSADEMMDSEMTVGQFFDATASALDEQADEQSPPEPNTANAAARYRQYEEDVPIDRGRKLKLRRVFQGSVGGDDAQATSKVNALDFLDASAQAVDGANLLTYNLTTGIPGVSSVTVNQYTIQPMTRATLGVGGSTQNSQVRFEVNIQALPLTGMTTPITIPLVIEGATADGLVDSLNCADPLNTSTAGIHVDTSGVKVTLGAATNITIPATPVLYTPGVVVQSQVVAGLPLLNVNVLLNLGVSPLQIPSYDLSQALTASATASVLGGSSDHTFLPYQTPVAFQRSPGGAGSATIGTQLSSSLTAQIGNTVLGAPAVQSLRDQRLQPIFDSVEAEIVAPLLQQIGAGLSAIQGTGGVAIAGADVKATDLKCEGAGLKLVG